jgi:hypothetical protein
MPQAIIKLQPVFYCTSTRPCKRTACVVHGEACYYLTIKNREGSQT